MLESKFWQILDNARSAAITSLTEAAHEDAVFDAQALALRNELSVIEFSELVSFELIYHEKMIEAYRWDLWGAAAWLFGGFGNDSFSDFCSNLIALGSKEYTNAIDEPDSLLDTMTGKHIPYMLSEGFRCIPLNVYEERGGPPFELCYPPYPGKPYGEDFDFEDYAEIARRFPRIAMRFPEHSAFY